MFDRKYLEQKYKIDLTPIDTGFDSTRGLFAPEDDERAKLDRATANYQERIRTAGAEPEKPENKTPWFLKALSYLDRPRSAVWTGVSDAVKGGNFGEGFMAGLKGERDYSGQNLMEDLGVENEAVKGWGGFFAEVAGDPLNLVTLGGGSLAKGFLTGAGKTLTKEAAEQLARGSIGSIGKEAVEKATRVGLPGKNIAKPILDQAIDREARQIALREVDKQFTKYGAKYAPTGSTSIDNMMDDAVKQLASQIEKHQTKTAGEGLSVGLPFSKNIRKTFKTDAQLQDMGARASDAFKKIPVVGTGLAKAQDWSRTIFNRTNIAGLDYGGRTVARALAKDIYGDMEVANAAARRTGEQFAETLGKAGKDANGDDFDMLISRVLEGDLPSGQIPADLKKIADQMRVDFDEMYDVEKKIGKATTKMNDYMPHVLSMDNAEKAQRLGGKTERYRVFNPAQQKRELRGSIPDANIFMKYKTASPQAREAFLRDLEQKLKLQPNVLSESAIANEIKNKGVAAFADRVKTAYGDIKTFNASSALDGVTDYFETSATKAYVLRALEHNKVVADQRFLDSLTNAFGKKITNPSDIASYINAGYDIVIPKSMLRFLKVGQGDAEMANNAIEAIDEIPGQIAKTVTSNRSGYVSKAAAGQLTRDAKAANATSDSILNTARQQVSSMRNRLMQGFQQMGKSDRTKLLKQINSLERRIMKDAYKRVAEQTSAAMKSATAASGNAGMKGLGKVASDAARLQANMYKAAHGIDLPGEKLRFVLGNLAQENGEAFAKLSDLDPDTFEEASKLIFANYRPLDVYAMPSGMIKYVNDASRKQVDEGMQNVERAMQAFYRVWKPLATSANPDYYIRNIGGNIFNSVLGVGMNVLRPTIQHRASQLTGLITNSKGAVDRSRLIAKLNGQELRAGEAAEAMISSGAASTFAGDAGELANELNLRLSGKLSGGSNPITRGAKAVAARVGKEETVYGKVTAPIRMGANRLQGFSSGIETQGKAAMFIAAWEDGIQKGMTKEEALGYAGELTNKYLFDYHDISTTERRILKNIFPFYTWMRKNMPLQMEQFLNRPAAYNTVPRLIDNVNEANGTDTSNMPDYVEEQGYMPIPGVGVQEDGRAPMVNLSMPYNDLNNIGNLGKTALTSLTPVAKVPAEMILNRQFINGAPIYRNEYERGGKLLQHAANSMGAVKNVNKSMVPAQTDGRAVSQYFPIAPAGAGASLVKGYNPSEAEIDSQYDYNRRLGNQVQYLKDQGVDVMTTREIDKTYEPVRFKNYIESESRKLHNKTQAFDNAVRQIKNGGL